MWLQSVLHFFQQSDCRVVRGKGSRKRFMYYQRERESGVRTKENERVSHLTIFPSRSLGHRCFHPAPSFQKTSFIAAEPLLFFSLANFVPVCAIQTVSS